MIPFSDIDATPCLIVDDRHASVYQMRGKGGRLSPHADVSYSAAAALVHEGKVLAATCDFTKLALELCCAALTLSRSLCIYMCVYVCVSPFQHVRPTFSALASSAASHPYWRNDSRAGQDLTISGSKCSPRNGELTTSSSPWRPQHSFRHLCCV